jgi:hypothetical protein
MTFDRSADDLPLAAYGGSGMELTADDKARLDAAPSLAADFASTDAASSATPGAFGDAAESEGPLEGEPGPRVDPGAVVIDAVTKVVTLLRTSRVAAGAAFGGVIVVGLLLLVGGGPKPNPAGATSSPTPAAVVIAPRDPGNATLVLTGALKQSLTFTQSAGAGAPSAGLAMTWSDPTANTFGLVGAVDRGTRSTDEDLVLAWTVMVGEKPITFTSTDGECTLGMAVTPTNVSGTFTCKKLKSDDGKYVVGATGTYRT